MSRWIYQWIFGENPILPEHIVEQLHSSLTEQVTSMLLSSRLPVSTFGQMDETTYHHLTRKKINLFLENVGEIRMYKDLSCELREGHTSCPICTDSLHDDTVVFVTFCFHLFCKACIEKWVIHEKKTSCPLCRSRLN